MSASPTLSYGTITPTRRPHSLRRPQEDDAFGESGSSPSFDNPTGTLHRSLSSRQVQMIAIAGTIGTGLFLGTGRSLAQGGPASMLLCHSIVGFIVYVTLLLLGEMATQYPIAGKCFCLSLAMFVEERSCASATFLSFSSLVSTYRCAESTEKFLSGLLFHLAIWEPILVTCTSR